MKKIFDVFLSIQYYWRKSPLLRRSILFAGSFIFIVGIALGWEKVISGRHLVLFAGVTLFAVLLITLPVFYLIKFHPKTLEEDKNLFLIAFVTLIIAFISKALFLYSGYLAPVGASAILVATLCGPGLVPLISVILALLIGIYTGEFQYAAFALIGGIAVGLSVSKAAKRSDLTGISFLILTITNALVILAFSLLHNEQFGTLLWNQLYGVINSVMSVIVALGSLPFLEALFGITTTIRLLELSNPNEPLLRMLLTEAPGTYHHSLIVANLAEQAAQAIGADPVLTRVGALYHDIGKAKRPYFFVENQFGGENPHDKLTPNLSTIIITSHTRDGVEMGRLHKIPQVIQNFMTEHHGTTVVQYFYHNALLKEGVERVLQEDYRHDGPKPQTKETAIVLLADEVEAATRAINKPTPQKIEETVREVVKHVEKDGQLEESPLSFKDLSVIINTFVKLLCGMYHSRIEYPDKSLIEMAERKAKEKGKVIKFGKS